MKKVLIFEKKGGVLMLLKTTLHLGAKAQYIGCAWPQATSYNVGLEHGKIHGVSLGEIPKFPHTLFFKKTRFQLVIGRDCMRRPEVNSRCE